MLGLSNPLNAMQILFINILMDGMLFLDTPLCLAHSAQDPHLNPSVWTQWTLP